ncbi:unnamed protein product [Didymodactylos carnosus]|uniref:Uncharacterized protein n=1 Tax=Didymodactylos carnosus TaxID=1234261 RepID=A0A813Q4N7_9BILA|nr:unnamed protein product [Didymodactylos carnosus]CAF0776141.1 unnamed protein product [Didymodactylos carnosus]CAF3542963.1 unnamed protein product [Didymodactylos carnosus]CAF3557344.1 unnamed protein product [Didymodactylos carnosus]
MGYPRWKLIENRRSDNLTVHIGLFDRCEDLSFNNNNLYKKTYSQCDSNKYLPSNSNYTTALCRNVSDENCQKLCNKPNNNYSCDYLRFTKGLIACTIVAACMIDNLNATQLADREQAIRDMATRNYNVRLDWSAGLEIASLIMTSFSLITQLLYLFRTWRSQAG